MSSKNSPDQESSFDPLSQAPSRLTARSNRLKMAIILVAILALGYQFLGHRMHAEAPASAAEDLRVPATHPPLEPDRPDLIGEPRIDE